MTGMRPKACTQKANLNRHGAEHMSVNLSTKKVEEGGRVQGQSGCRSDLRAMAEQVLGAGCLAHESEHWDSTGGTAPNFLHFDSLICSVCWNQWAAAFLNCRETQLPPASRRTQFP